MNKLALVASATLILSAVACDRNDGSPSSGQRSSQTSTQPGGSAAGNQSAQNTPRSDVAPGVVPGQSSPASQSPSDTRTAQMTFESADKDKDGSVSRTEASSIQGLDFSTADTDKSSSLSRQEFQTAMATARPRG